MMMMMNDDDVTFQRSRKRKENNTLYTEGGGEGGGGGYKPKHGKLNPWREWVGGIDISRNLNTPIYTLKRKKQTRDRASSCSLECED
jgi:hypothetical protein